MKMVHVSLRLLVSYAFKQYSALRSQSPDARFYRPTMGSPFFFMFLFSSLSSASLVYRSDSVKSMILVVGRKYMSGELFLKNDSISVIKKSDWQRVSRFNPISSFPLIILVTHNHCNHRESFLYAAAAQTSWPGTCGDSLTRKT